MAEFTEQLSDVDTRSASFTQQGVVDTSLATAITNVGKTAKSLFEDEDDTAEVLAPLQTEAQTLFAVQAARQDIRTQLSAEKDAAKVKLLQDSLAGLERLTGLSSAKQIEARKRVMLQQFKAANPSLMKEADSLVKGLFGGDTGDEFATERAAEQEEAELTERALALNIDRDVLEETERNVALKENLVAEQTLLIEQGKVGLPDAVNTSNAYAGTTLTQALGELKGIMQAKPEWHGGIPAEEGAAWVESVMSLALSSEDFTRLLKASEGKYDVAGIESIRSPVESLRTVLTSIVESRNPQKLLNDMSARGTLRMIDAFPASAPMIAAMKDGAVNFMYTTVPSFLDQLTAAGGNFTLLQEQLDDLTRDPNNTANMKRAADLSQAMQFVKANYAQFMKDFATGLSGQSRPETFNAFQEHFYSKLYGNAFEKLGNPASPDYSPAEAGNAFEQVLEGAKKVDWTQLKAISTPQALNNLRKNPELMEDFVNTADTFAVNINNDGMLGIRLWTGSSELSFTPATSNPLQTTKDRFNRQGLKAAPVIQLADKSSFTNNVLKSLPFLNVFASDTTEAQRNIDAINHSYAVLWNTKGPDAANAWAESIIGKTEKWTAASEKEALTEGRARIVANIKNPRAYGRSEEEVKADIAKSMEALERVDARLLEIEQESQPKKAEEPTPENKDESAQVVSQEDELVARISEIKKQFPDATFAEVQEFLQGIA